MKKNILSLAALLFASATFVACSSSDDSIIEKPQQPAGPKTYTMTVQASKVGDGTRALTLSGSTLSAIWTENDEVDVYNSSSVKIGTLQAKDLTDGGQSCTLKGTLDTAPSANETLTLKFLSPSYSTQNGTLAYIAANCDFATASVSVKSITGTDITTTNADFANQQAIVKFTLTAPDGTTLLTPTALTVSDGTNDVASLTVIPTTTYTTNGNGVLFVALPGITNKTVTLTATIGGNNYIYTTKSNVSFSNGQYYAINVKVPLAKTFDYTGAEQTFTVPATGYYTLECYGAQGGYCSSGLGGKGGLSQLTYPLTQGDVLYIYVGGQGGCIDGSSSHPEGGNGGWNGGGKGGKGVAWGGGNGNPYNGGGGGGGATHIATSAIGQITGSTDFTNNHAGLLLIAGGGGGGLSWGSSSGGAGGGAEGGNGHRGNDEWNIAWNNGTLSCGRDGMTSSNGGGSCEGCGGGGGGYQGGNTWTVTYNASNQSYSGAGGSSWGDTTNGKGYSTTTGGATAGGNGKAVITWYGTTYPTE